MLRTLYPLYQIPRAVAVGGDSSVTRARPRLALSEVMTTVPGIDVQDRYNYALGDRVSVRGFGARTQFGIRGIKVLVDGIPATVADGQTTIDHLDLGNVSRVEVIRGPSASLYGNASGGVLRFETGHPAEHDFNQQFEVLAGSDGLVRVESSTSGRAGPTTIGLDLSVFTYDGYREHSSANKFFGTWRVGFDTPKDRLRLVANYVNFDAQNPGSLNDSVATNAPDVASPFNVIQGAMKDAWQGNLGLSWNRATGTGAFEIAGYGLLRDLYNPIPIRVIELDRLAAGVRAQLDGTHQVGTYDLQWVGGVETDLQRDDRKNFENEGGSAGALTLDQRETVWNLGGYAQLGGSIGAMLSWQAGLRYDIVRFEVNDRFSAPGNPDESGDRTLDQFSPSLGMLLDVSDPLRFYGNVSTSFETPTTTELGNSPGGAGGFNPDLEPQTAVSVEVGAKGVLGRAADYQIAVYYADVQGELIPFEVPSDSGRTFFRNAGSSVHKGIEIGASWTPIAAFALRATYTYTDARFDEYRTADEVFDGNRIPGVPPHRAEVFGAFDAATWYVTADARFVDEIPTNDANTAAADSYALVGIRAGVKGLALGTTSLSPYAGVTNLFDVSYMTSVVVNAFGGRYFEPGPLRSFYIGGAWTFGRR